MRPATANDSGDVAEIMRLTRWPPAEWPINRTGPSTRAAAASMARPTSSVMPLTRVSGQSV